jgi:formylglycine-generating enzyme required for sulfatase activity
MPSPVRAASACLLAFAGLAWSEPKPSCPPDMVPVPGRSDVCIDRFPWPNRAGERPSVGLSGLPEQQDVKNKLVMDITRLCRSVGKRVCLRKEWVSSCRGDHGAPYPWGDELPIYTPGKGPQLACNADKAYRGVDERLVYLRDPDEMRRLDQTEPCGSRPGCISAAGMVDAVGQVEEWVRCPGHGRHHWCLMGGHAATPRACDDTIGGHAPRWHYALTGGRCCLDLNLED